jgi:prepilin-type N-terminal cleavage/methylation domain-containing protein
MKAERGFSVIEFLVVGAIFGILALIAIPQYSIYKQKGYNTAATNDLRNIAAAQQRFFDGNQSFVEISHCDKIKEEEHCKIKGLPGVSQLSKGIVLNIEAYPDGFQGSAHHVNSSSVCRWDSRQGGMLGCKRTPVVIR